MGQHLPIIVLLILLVRGILILAVLQEPPRFTNAATGIAFKDNVSGTATFNAGVAFVNNGTVNSPGTFTFSSSPLTNTGTFTGSGPFVFTAGPGFLNNTGTISPGSPTGVLTVSPNFVTGKTPAINIGIASTGASRRNQL